MVCGGEEGRIVAESFEKKQKDYLYKPKEMYFEKAAHEFSLIDDASIPIIVNWSNSMELVSQLKSEGPSYKLMKALGQYTVSLRQNDFKILSKMGQIEEVIEGIYVIKDKEQYNEKVGLLTENRWLEETWII